MGHELGTAVAALTMYDWLEVRPANDRFWRAVAESLQDRGIDAPVALTRDTDVMELWSDPNLLLAQTCGLPFVRYLSSTTEIVATPCYDADGCEGPHYRSFIIVPRDSGVAELGDLKGRTAALNNWDSQSGFSAFRAALSIAADPGKPIFDNIVISGSHRRSINLVADGQADVASIDVVSWALARRYEHRAVAQLRILGETRPTPGLPLITAAGKSPATIELMRAALDEGLAATDPGDRDQLLLSGFEPLSSEDYQIIEEMDKAFSLVQLGPDDPSDAR